MAPKVKIIGQAQSYTLFVSHFREWRNVTPREDGQAHPVTEIHAGSQEGNGGA